MEEGGDGAGHIVNNGREQSQTLSTISSIPVRNEFVSDAVHSANQNRTVRIWFDFLAQSGDAVVDRAIARTLAFRPGGADQLLTRHYDARAHHQKFQNLELA